MQECPKCNITIRGNKECCPLCKGSLTGKPEDPAFPVIRPKKVGRVTFLKISAFLTLVSIIVLTLLAFLLPEDKNDWVSMVIICILFAFTDVCLVIYYKRNALRVMTTQFYLVLLLVFLIDLKTGAHGFSVSFVWPAGLILLLLFTLITGRICGLELGDYMIYLVLDVLLSFVQLIPGAARYNVFPALAWTSIAAMLVFAAFIIIFRFRELKNASSKYLNM